MDGYVLPSYYIYGGAIPEGFKGNIFKYELTVFNEEKDKFALAYSAQATKENGFVWIGFPDNEILIHDVSVEMVKQGHKKYINVMGRIKDKKYKDQSAAKTVL